MTIRTRLTIRFTGLVSAILALTFASVYGFCWYYISSDFYQRLDRKAHTYGELFLKQRVEAKVLRQFNRLRKDQLPSQKITIYDARNTPIFTTNDAILGMPARELNAIGGQRRRDFRWQHYYVTGVRYSLPSGNYIVLASAENVYGDVFLRTLLWAFGGLFLLIVGVVAFAGRLYAGDALEPMQRIEHQLSAIFPGTLHERLRVSGENDELSRLSATINRLLDRIEESFRLQRMFVANVSHELKNPLTQINSQLEVSLLNRREPEAYQQTIRSVLEDVQDLSALTRELLQLSQVSAADAAVLLTDSVRVDEVIWDVRQDVSAINARYDVVVDLGELPDDFDELTITGNLALLRTALKNLTENACKFSSKGRAVVAVGFQEEVIRISIENDGQSIPEADLPYIFEPFYRARQTADIRGYGVGLSLVQQIVRLHRGRLSVQSAEGEPTIFLVELPR
ncbi:sensor histidine kinase [Spirosoma utsteinense]|uniref:histidine kinase n=1 Tax=Spirosoma utsteinense TaxID=2585773 RepID=A0ABR6WBV3_9BACT|nr:HAMP domain-containing sensor histidine kinase [Spirosoma utsteinense]MBC3786973.1 signal transduction histidine kinase [Spirosoma utsteinense]MBC3794045.1 signal transduction histidine kinase [Spirosoma utsteinense]